MVAGAFKWEARNKRKNMYFWALNPNADMEITAGQLLSQIEYPSDLRKLSKEQLHQVCDELRQFIIDVVSVHGGHFGASLGVVELTVALHYAF